MRSDEFNRSLLILLKSVSVSTPAMRGALFDLRLCRLYIIAPSASKLSFCSVKNVFNQGIMYDVNLVIL